MIPKRHIILGFLFSLILYLCVSKINLIDASIIFLSSFLIDIDHYIFYAFKKKSFNLKKSIKYFFRMRKKRNKLSLEKRNKVYNGFYFLHGIEWLIILFLLGIFLSRYFILIFIGFSFHIFLDLLDFKPGERIDKISVIYDWFKFKKLKLVE